MSERQIFVTGYNAFVIGATVWACPFTKKQKTKMAIWLDGYCEAKRKKALRCL